MIDIKKIRFKAALASEGESLRKHIIHEVNGAAELGFLYTSIVYKDGNKVIWSVPIIDAVAEDLRKDGFNISKKDDYHRQKSWLYIDWAETYADTDSVKLPESCPEVAPTCNTCRWYNVTRIPPCDMGNKPENPKVQGCNLYESED